MRNKIIIVVLAASLLIVYFFFVNEYQAQSIEEALDLTNPSVDEIIHIEALEGSYFAVSKRSDYLHAALVNKLFGRYKTMYSGVHGDIEIVAEVFGVTDSYFPGIKYASKPLLYGVIGNSEISKLELFNTESNEVIKIDIIEKDGFRLWIKSLKNTADIGYILKGYNETGIELISRKLKFKPREIKSTY
ncbi:MAG TPA: hypothetical protein VJ962_01770 [Clostridia bacterium]|nr:hypothetical protein [Clostridia bacterium]